MKYPELITPVVGQVYHNHGGADYRCTEVLDSSRAVMVRLHDNWTLVAHGVRQYDNRVGLVHGRALAATAPLIPCQAIPIR